MKVEICKLDSNRNLADREVKWLVQAIDSFSRNVSDAEAEQHARNKSNAFSYYALPAFNKKKHNTRFTFKKEWIYQDNQTTEGNSNPAALACLCRKDGLLYDQEGRFELSEIAQALLLNDRITTREYAFILLSKQWVRVDDTCKVSLLALLYELIQEDANFIDKLYNKEDEAKQAIFKKATGKDITTTDQVDFNRYDILRNMMELSGLISLEKDTPIMAEEARSILEDFHKNSDKLSKYESDEKSFYVYICANDYGALEIISPKNVEIYAKLYPNLAKTAIGRSYAPKDKLQVIYFGSPGTGKSFGIKKHLLEQGIDEELKKNCDRLFRTTFHPDTDYSSFVGCYKPTKAQKGIKYDLEYLKKEFAKVSLERQKKVKECIRFISKYAEAIYALREGDKVNSVIKEILGDNANGMDTYLSEFTAEIVKERLKGADITYSFTAQAFTNAYVKAWETYQENPANPLPVYLVIEEINRGNCAQIFGDLFQLLDRKGDGSSEYPVKADTDLRNYLIELDKWGPNHPGIEGGNLCLPPNLYILATMNTSDQSLFPMDSAFKRRWEWKYVPTCVTSKERKSIKVNNENEVTLYDQEFKELKLHMGMYEYDWSTFLEKINERIGDATNSDDKQLGFWFVKTKEGSNLIDIDTFVSKVIFYLWNDVFKDFGKKKTNPFAHKNSKNEWVICSFSSFFDQHTGEVNLGSIHSFMYNLGIIPHLEPKADEAALKSMATPPGDPE